MAALERMRLGRTLLLPPGFKWSKQSWAVEADLNKDTVVAKNADGSWKFAEETAAFQQGMKLRLGRVHRLKAELAALQDENLRLKQALLVQEEQMLRSA
jgi:hypothetical protein